jgi:hypothetical protein
MGGHIGKGEREREMRVRRRGRGSSCADFRDPAAPVRRLVGVASAGARLVRRDTGRGERERHDGGAPTSGLTCEGNGGGEGRRCAAWRERHRLRSRDENGTDIFRPYSRPNSFKGVLIRPYLSPDI